MNERNDGDAKCEEEDNEAIYREELTLHRQMKPKARRRTYLEMKIILGNIRADRNQVCNSSVSAAINLRDMYIFYVYHIQARSHVYMCAYVRVN